MHNFKGFLLVVVCCIFAEARRLDRPFWNEDSYFELMEQRGKRSKDAALCEKKDAHEEVLQLTKEFVNPDKKNYKIFYPTELRNYTGSCQFAKNKPKDISPRVKCKHRTITIPVVYEYKSQVRSTEATVVDGCGAYFD